MYAFMHMQRECVVNAKIEIKICFAYFFGFLFFHWKPTNAMCYLLRELTVLKKRIKMYVGLINFPVFKWIARLRYELSEIKMLHNDLDFCNSTVVSTRSKLLR